MKRSSICPSACPVIRPQPQSAAGFLLIAVRAGDIDPQRRRRERLLGTLKMRNMKLRDMKMRHHVAGVENARHENARMREMRKCEKSPLVP